MSREERYPDSPSGARAYLAADSALPGVEDAAARPDPTRKGVWEVKTDDWRAIVYLAGHGSFPPIHDNDFEVEEG